MSVLITELCLELSYLSFWSLQVDVFKGTSTSLLGSKMCVSSRIHGSDGLGDEGHNFDPVNLADIKEENASVALVRLVKQHPGQITLVTLGPVTNVAIASLLWTDFSKNLKQLCMMGGNHLGKSLATSASHRFV